MRKRTPVNAQPLQTQGALTGVAALLCSTVSSLVAIDTSSHGAGKRRGAKQTPARARRGPAAATLPDGPTVVWLRQDLRIHDNPALHAAARSGESAVCLYVWSEHEEGTAAEWCVLLRRPCQPTGPACFDSHS
jgi:hypothetical protein